MPKPEHKWYDIKAKSEDVAEVWIYDEIGEDWFGEGITAKRFVEEITALEVSDIALHINSPGGSVFDGQAIYTALKRHSAKVTTYIDGLAASIASVVAMAGDTIIMPSNAMMMIHDPWAITLGNSTEMRKMADTLDKVSETILNVYAERSDKPREEIAAAMAAETWLTASDAAEYGFVDDITSDMRIAASFDLSRFRHVPAGFAACAMEPEEVPEEVTADEVAETPPAPAAEAVVEARDTVYLSGVGVVSVKPNRKD